MIKILFVCHGNTCQLPMDDLHESQKRVDRLDYLIRQTEKTVVR